MTDYYHQEEPKYSQEYAIKYSSSYDHDLKVYDEVYTTLGQIKLFGWMYDLAYKTFEIVKDMIAPGRDINIIVSADEADGDVCGIAYINLIVIYPIVILKTYPSTLWNTCIINTVCHELYHCVLIQDSCKYDNDDNYNNLIESQTEYMVISFIQNNRALLEYKLCMSIDTYQLTYLYSYNYGMFCKEISNIQYMDKREVWIQTILNGSIDNDLIINIIDNTDNVNVTFYSCMQEDDKLEIPEEWYCVDDVVKKDGIFTSPCKEVMDVKIQSAGSLNYKLLDETREIYYSYDTEEDGSVTIYIGFICRRKPLFYKLDSVE